jgi:hypothetical protein
MNDKRFREEQLGTDLCHDCRDAEETQRRRDAKLASGRTSRLDYASHFE